MAMADNRFQKQGHNKISIESYQKGDEDDRNSVVQITRAVTTNNDAENGRCFDSFPNDVLLQCFTFLTLSDLANVQLTSRCLNTIVNTDEKGHNNSWLWKHAYDLRFLYRVHIGNNDEQQKYKQPIDIKAMATVQCKLQDDWKSHYKQRLAMTAGYCNLENFSTRCCSSRYKDSNDNNNVVWVFENGAHTHTPLSRLRNRFSQSIRSKSELLEYANGWSYFEATVCGEGSVGIVSISTDRDRRLYGEGSQDHIGWRGFSYGYHNDDGYVYASDGSDSRMNYRKIQYGPPWGNQNTWTMFNEGIAVNSQIRQEHAHHVVETETQDMENDEPSSVVGCGYNCMTNELFFTKDGKFLGLVPFKPHAGVSYAAAVTLHVIDDRVKLNSGHLPFLFDIYQFCLTS